MNGEPQSAANEIAGSTSPPGPLRGWLFRSRAGSATGAPGSLGHPPDALFLRLVRGWIWLSALAGLAGWSLSALGQLNRTGYACFFAAVAGILLAYRRRWDWGAPNWGKFLRRFRRPLPGAFAGLAALVFLGSCWYAPSNYTGLNYHLGRVLQWLAHGQWWWIHTPVNRMNFAGCAFEWLTTPVVLFTHSDRALFLVNFLPFLLLPGLIFSVFTRLGVRRRVAWHWMWLLPTGYNILLQAGSIGNDGFSVTYALAAIDFACRAWESRRLRDAWLSLLAVALMTGTKPVSLPLLLPWVILMLPLWPWLRRHWLATLPVAALAGLISFLPIALMNELHCGDWLARNIEIIPRVIHQPATGVLGNAIQLLVGNFAPPVFPAAGWWNQHAATFLPHSLAAALNTDFDGPVCYVGELPTEDYTGLGFGVSLLLLVSVLGAIWAGGNAPKTPVHGPIPGWLCRGVQIAVWMALLTYSLKSGMCTAARLVAPYYLLLLPLLLTGAGHSQIIRRGWWRVLAGGVLGLALVVLGLSPDRPLWPAKTILSRVVAQHPGPAAVARALEVYTIYSKRNDALAGVRALLPPDLKTVGFIGDGDDCDISLWRPFGRRQVEHFFVTDPPALLRSKVDYVVVGGWNLSVNQLSLDRWLRWNGARLVATTNVTVKIVEGPQAWYVTRLKP